MTEPYVYRPYPKYVTHATAAPRVVQTEDEHRALGPGWGLDDDEAVTAETATDDPPAAKAAKATKKK